MKYRGFWLAGLFLMGLAAMLAFLIVTSGYSGLWPNLELSFLWLAGFITVAAVFILLAKPTETQQQDRVRGWYWKWAFASYMGCVATFILFAAISVPILGDGPLGVFIDYAPWSVFVFLPLIGPLMWRWLR